MENIITIYKKIVANSVNLQGFLYSNALYPRQLRNDHLMALYDIKPGGHLPAEGLPEKLAGNVQVYVKPSAGPGRRGKAYFIRFMCICPRCGTHLPAGRLEQHIDTKKCKTTYYQLFMDGIVFDPEV